jgi:hypothetical protein
LQHPCDVGQKFRALGAVDETVIEGQCERCHLPHRNLAIDYPRTIDDCT